jgi:FkbM family methyltransferase
MEAFGVQVVVDVGAHEGGYAREVRSAGFDGRIVSIEPDPQSLIALDDAASRDPRWDVIPAAAGDRTQHVTLRRYGMSTLNSLHDLQGAQGLTGFDEPPTATAEVSAGRLDDLLGGTKVGDGSANVLLKIDVQGHELEVLRGAPRTLDRAVLVEIEIPFTPIYASQATARAILDVVDDLGFVPCGVAPLYVDSRTAVMAAADFLFRRDPTRTD